MRWRSLIISYPLQLKIIPFQIMGRDFIGIGFLYQPRVERKRCSKLVMNKECSQVRIDRWFLRKAVGDEQGAPGHRRP